MTDNTLEKESQNPTQATVNSPRSELNDNVFANDHDNQIDNKSGNKRFTDFVNAGMKRRDLIKGSAAAAVTSFVAGWQYLTPRQPVTNTINGITNVVLLIFHPFH